MRALTLVSASIAVVALGASIASAQGVSSYSRSTNSSFGIPTRPPISPYVNLLNTSQDRRILYTGIIRPQLDTQRIEQFQQQQFDQLQRDALVQNSRSSQLLTAEQQELERLQTALGLKTRETGIHATFMDRSRYFPGLQHSTGQHHTTTQPTAAPAPPTRGRR